jgi:branched-chain amino acid transport system permease protein
VIVTLGLLIVLEGGIGLIFGYSSPLQPLSVPLPSGFFNAGSVALSLQQIVLSLIPVVLILGLYLGMRFTLAGAAVRAVAQSAEGARLVGIRVWRVRLLAWGLGALLAAAAGILIAPASTAPIGPSMAEPYLLSAFAGAVIGGLDSLAGAAIGGWLLGVVQNLVAFYTPRQVTDWGIGKDAIVFVLLLCVLVVRPAGLFGTPVQRRV